MIPRSLAALLILLVITGPLSGCTGVPPVPETTTPTPTPPLPPTISVPETTPTPEVTPSPEPFPGALSLGTPYRYGREDISMEVTPYKVRVMREYDWWSWKWGRYWNATARKGYHFFFVFVRFIDRGTARALLPAPHTLVLKSNGNSYIETTDRDPSIPIKGIDVKQYKYSYDDTAGWIDPGESNRVEGFMIYEVPESVTPENSYLSVIFTGKAAAVWKLG